MNRVWILVVAAVVLGLGTLTACGHGHGYYGFDYYYDDYYYYDYYYDYYCDCYYYKPEGEAAAGEVW